MARPIEPVAIVTGGSSGAGRRIARTLASRGYAVVVVYLRDQRQAELAVEEILAANATALAVRADLTDELDVERLFVETTAAYGGTLVAVDRADGSTATFRITGLTRVAKTRFPTDLVYGPTLDPTLRLVTCGGSFDHTRGTYRDNIIAFAALA